MGAHSDYTKVTENTAYIHTIPQDIEDNYREIMRILNGQKNHISEYKKVRIRQENITLLRGRLDQLVNGHHARALETMKNLRG